MIGSKIPPLDVTDAQAKRLVQGSPLRGLTPGPGMSSANWQELAALATQLPDITWLGTVVHTFDCGHDCYDAHEMPVIDGHLCYNFPAIHSGPTCDPRDGRKVPTDHEIYYHRCRFAEKVLKYGGIDFVLRLFSLYEATDVQGRGGVLQIFTQIKSPQALLQYLPKIRYFLEHQHFNECLIPCLKKEDEGFSSSEVEVPEWLKKHGFCCDRKRQKRPPLTAQRISNALLLMVITQGHSTAEVRAEAIRQCREQLGAQLTKDDAFLCTDIITSLDAWSEISQAGQSSFAHFKACMTSGAPQTTCDAQGGAREARMLIEAALSGRVCVSEARAVAEMFLAKRQFDEAGMKVICGEYGLTETETELPSMADDESKQQARTLQALGVVLNGNVANILDGAGVGAQKLK